MGDGVCKNILVEFLRSEQNGTQPCCIDLPNSGDFPIVRRFATLKQAGEYLRQRRELDPSLI
jgi:hypothetical protein